jgi:RNA polymerase sigma factor (TIGR02999 family)
MTDQGNLDELFSATYEELRRLAASVKRADPSQTLNPTALVNEAYLKLSDSLRMKPESRLHFKRIAARAMRQVLVESARRRKSLKRGGGKPLVTFDPALDGVVARSDELLALDSALQDLAGTNPRQAQLVEYRFFGGLDAAETARLLEVSESTVLREWRAARAWLLVQLGGAAG